MCLGVAEKKIYFHSGWLHVKNIIYVQHQLYECNAAMLTELALYLLYT